MGQGLTLLTGPHLEVPQGLGKELGKEPEKELEGKELEGKG